MALGQTRSSDGSIRRDDEMISLCSLLMRRKMIDHQKEDQRGWSNKTVCTGEEEEDERFRCWGQKKKHRAHNAKSH